MRGSLPNGAAGEYENAVMTGEADETPGVDFRGQSVVITGSDSIEQFDDNRAAFDWKLSEDELARLDERFVEMMVW